MTDLALSPEVAEWADDYGLDDVRQVGDDVFLSTAAYWKLANEFVHRHPPPKGSWLSNFSWPGSGGVYQSADVTGTGRTRTLEPPADYLEALKRETA